MDNEPLSQQADSSPNKSGEQLPKAPPHVKGAAKGDSSKHPSVLRTAPLINQGSSSLKLLPLQRGGGSESQRGKSKVLT